ncbi:MAG: hypothetical protein H6714_08055 [Myxococcales bacterium]|nr:hypothetical protein [Myxococcales bacterium]
MVLRYFLLAVALLALDGCPRKDSHAIDSGTILTDVESDGQLASDTYTSDDVEEPCQEGCATQLSSYLVVTGPPSAPRFQGASRSDGQTLITWAASDGVVVRTLDSDGARVGSDVSVAGRTPWAIASGNSGFGVLVTSRSVPSAPNIQYDDILTLFAFDQDGHGVFSRKLAGTKTPSVEGSEWFPYEPFTRAELVWQAEHWIPYFTILRQFENSGGVHQTDRLLYIKGDGTLGSGPWEGGCSHSLDLRIASNGTQLGTTCLSDCFPEKAILFSHWINVQPDSSGNCLGAADSRLGGLVPMGKSYWQSFATPEGRDSMDIGIRRIQTPDDKHEHNTAEATIWLTDNALAEDRPKLTAFKGGLIAAWRDGDHTRIEVLTASGSAVEHVETDFPLDEYSNLWSYPDGSAGWLYADAAGLHLVRVQ